MKGHRELIVWQKAMDLVVKTYELTRTFPKCEVYSLSNQMQTAAVSGPSNISEGQALKQTLAYVWHLAIASGSLAELQTQFKIARRLGYLPAASEGIIELANQVERMLAGLRKSLLGVAES